MPQEKAVLRPRGEHPVGFVHALGDEVIDQHPDVRLVPPQDERLSAQRVESRVDTRHDALRGSLLVSRGTVDLTGTEEACHHLRLETERELLWRQVVILHGISRTHQPGVFKAGSGVDDHLLHEDRQAGGQALKVHLLCGDALRFHEDRMVLPLREVDELAIDGRTVARALAAHGAALEGTQMKVFGHDVVSRRRRVGKITGHLPPRGGRHPV